MSGTVVRDFSQPDETRTPPKTKVEVIDLGGTKAARFNMEPGWRWSECVQPIVGGDRCQNHHVGVVLSGRMGIENADGTTAELGPGQAFSIDPGHEAWVIGDEAFNSVEFDQASVAGYATPK